MRVRSGKTADPHTRRRTRPSQSSKRLPSRSPGRTTPITRRSFPVTVGLADDRDRALDRARGGDRVHCRVLGSSSLMGQRTVPVILMIVLEIVLTPILLKSGDPSPGQSATRAGGTGHGSPRTERLALDLGVGGGPGGPGGSALLSESTTVAAFVIVGLARGMDCPRHVADGAQRRLIRSLGDPQHHHHHRVQVINTSHGSRFALSPRTGLPAP